MHLAERIRVPLPDYRPHALHTLWHLLGESDAATEWGEVALREFAAVHAKGGPQAVEQLAEKHGIRVNDFQEQALRAHWARLQVIAAAHYMERFLDSFRREFPREVTSRSNDEPLIRYTLRAYGVGAEQVGELQFELLLFYQRLRNWVLHEGAQQDKKRLQTEAAKLKERVAASSLYATLQAPNSAEAVCFDDFVLLTRALKDFSKGLCQHAAPTRLEMQTVLATRKDLIKELRRQNNIRRRTRLLANCIVHQFGFISLAEKLAAEMLENGLLAQR